MRALRDLLAGRLTYSIHFCSTCSDVRPRLSQTCLYISPNPLHFFQPLPLGHSTAPRCLRPVLSLPHLSLGLKYSSRICVSVRPAICSIVTPEWTSSA